jgi:hypothetical protein
MDEEKIKKSAINAAAYCGQYCRTFYWYSNELEQTAQYLWKLIKDNPEAADWIDCKGRNSKTAINGLEILFKSACNFNRKGGSGSCGRPVRKCCIFKDSELCFEYLDSTRSNQDEKVEYANAFTVEKKNGSRCNGDSAVLKF